MPSRGALMRGCAGVAGPLVLLLTLASCSAGAPAPAARTATVTRGDVTAGVAANGSFAAVSSVDLGFATGGRLTSVKVKVGSRVQAGDVLATVDNRAARRALEQAEANLDAQQAGLDRITSATTVSGAQSTVNQAQTVVSATKGQVAATAEADQKTIDRARAQLSTDQDAKDDAEDAASTVQNQCDDEKAAVAAAQQSSQLLAQAQQQLQSDDPSAVAQAQETLKDLSSKLASSTGTVTAAACSSALTAKAAVTAAKQKVVADQTALVAAQQKKKVDGASGKLAVESARQAVVAAQNGLSSSSADRPHSIDQQQALVAAAQAVVATAQKAVDDTKLVAPSDGTITVVNGTKGEYVTPSTGTTAQAPGSRAAIPGSSSVVGATGASRPAGGQFMVLSDVEQLQLVLPFEQSDAARIKPGQRVLVQADALPHSELAGKVLAVSPTSTVTSGAISYLATVGLGAPDRQLKDGQTGRGTVITQQRTNVLTVPNAAVHQQGSATTVVVVTDGGSQRAVPFEAGAVGDEQTEVVSGLTEGQHVVLPDGAR